MDYEKLYENWERSQKALENLSWDTIRKVRNANQRLFPLDWKKVKKNWKYGELTIKTADEFEKKLKEVCDSLYDWGIYELCPKCKKGIKIPVWNFTQWTLFCGCSEFPYCNYSVDRGGEIFGNDD